MQSFLGDDKDSRIALLSHRAESTFRVLFSDDKHEPLEILMADFIDEKSPKAKGKRISTLDIASFEDITPEPEVSPDETGETFDGKEDSPAPSDISDPSDTSDSSDISDSSDSSDTSGSSNPAEVSAIDVEGVTMTFEKPKDTQLDLF